jgi:hypothetical protein
LEEIDAQIASSRSELQVLKVKLTRTEIESNSIGSGPRINDLWNALKPLLLPKLNAHSKVRNSRDNRVD